MLPALGVGLRGLGLRAEAPYPQRQTDHDVADVRDPRPATRAGSGREWVSRSERDGDIGSALVTRSMRDKN